jgi:hypothetical protein
MTAFRPRIADVVLFNDEVDLLRVRLAEHYEFVDKFYVVEATRTFTYKQKPLYFASSIDQFGEWSAKIEHIIVDSDRMFVPADPFENERRQRGFVVNQRDVSAYDYILQLDADEIIDRRSFSHVLRAMAQGHATIAPRLRAFYYFLDAELEHPWEATRVFRVHAGQVGDVSVAVGGFPTPELVGWHFSFLGSPATIRRKIESYAHVEFALPEFTSEREIRKRMRSLSDPFGREDAHGKLTLREPGDWLPIYIREHFEHYRQYTYASGVELPADSSRVDSRENLQARQLATRVRSQEAVVQQVSVWAASLNEAVVLRDAEIRRLQAALDESVSVRDAEIRRLQTTLDEAVTVRDVEIRRLQGLLETAVGVTETRG